MGPSGRQEVPAVRMMSGVTVYVPYSLASGKRRGLGRGEIRRGEKRTSER